MNNSNQKEGDVLKLKYIDFLPDIFKQYKDNFLEGYLNIFQKILSGINDGIKIENFKSLSDILNTISDYFYPDTIEEEGFLDWFSTWFGLILKEDWTKEEKQKVIADIIPIYRMRGTRLGLETLLKIYIGEDVKVYNSVNSLQVGVNSYVEIGTILGSPYYFLVETTLPDLKSMERKMENVVTIINREKPVHTAYDINWTKVPAMQIEVKSTVGIDTLIWNFE